MTAASSGAEQLSHCWLKALYGTNPCNTPDLLHLSLIWLCVRARHSSAFRECLSERDPALGTDPTATSLLNPSKPHFSHSVLWNKTIVTAYLFLSDISIALPLRNSACFVWIIRWFLILCLYCVLKCFYCCSTVPQVSWLQSAVSTTGLLLCLGKQRKIGLLVLPNALERALNICTNTHARGHIISRYTHAHTCTIKLYARTWTSSRCQGNTLKRSPQIALPLRTWG